MKKIVFNFYATLMLIAGLTGSDCCFGQAPLIYAQSPDMNVCEGTSVTFTVNSTGEAPFSFQWKKNGNNIPGANDSVYVIPSAFVSDNQGVYTCIVANNYGSDTTLSSVLNVIRISAEAGSASLICYNSQVPLQAFSGSNHPALTGNFYYHWYPEWMVTDAYISNPMAFPYYNQSFTVFVSDDMGCSGWDTVSVFVKEPFVEEICMIATDSATGKCIVVWEKTPGKGTVQYNIYVALGPQKSSETLIATVPYNDMSAYLDMNSRPDSTTMTYRISTVDTCGNESSTSNFHMTAFLSVNPDPTPGIYNLNWMPYYGFYYDTVYIYRGHDPYTCVKIDSIPNGETWYVDSSASAFTDEVYYYIEMIKKDSCIATSSFKASSTTYTSSSSNMEQFRLVGVAENKPEPLHLYPNPVNDVLHIRGMKDATLLITDATGRIVWKGKNQESIDVSGLENGVYLLKAHTGRGVTAGKFIKQ